MNNFLIFIYNTLLFYLKKCFGSQFFLWKCCHPYPHFRIECKKYFYITFFLSNRKLLLLNFPFFKFHRLNLQETFSWCFFLEATSFEFKWNGSKLIFLVHRYTFKLSFLPLFSGINLSDDFVFLYC